MKDLTQGSVTRHLLTFSAFIAVSMLFQTMYFLERACAVLDIPVAKMRVSTPTTRRRVS